MKTDIQLQDDVQQALKWASEVDACHIAVMTKDGAVTLSGNVPAYIQKVRAVAATEHVYGVKAVADEIEVRIGRAHARDDSEIAESIARILEWNATLAGQHIQARVAKGHVTLMGEVDSIHQREEAASAVHRLGVTAVTDSIKVKPRAVIAQVERKIADALTRHAALDARQIHVMTSGSTATLTGHVHSLDEARVAKRAALSAPGISKVEDRLVIQP